MSDIEQFDFEEIKNALAKDDKKAEERYNKYKSTDPFPEIDPALLNSADIIDYIIATGMIHPFHPKMATLKPASYAVPILGTCACALENKNFWEEEDFKVIEKGDIFTLERNSISFVELEPQFRIPDYIALRFNLKITHVYQGLLLGTGPLVDPGFQGKLFIPLHNLTTNDYQIVGGEDLVYFEFTKLSPIAEWKNNNILDSEKIGKYISFPKNKIEKRKTLIDYLRVADSHRKIKSSIPEIIKEQEKALTRFKWFNIITLGIAGITIVLSLWALFFEVRPLAIDTTKYIREVRDQNTDFQKIMKTEIIDVQEEVNQLKKIITSNNKEIQILKSQLADTTNTQSSKQNE